MRLSTLFGRTLRQAPAEAETTSHRLLLRGGFVRPVAAGIYAYLPLGWAVLRRLEAILREEMTAIGGQEVRLPVLHPADLWRATDRWSRLGPELIRFQDRTGRDFALGMTHEEVITALARQEIRSYRQLPCLVYQIHTKVRDEPRPRGGLIRLREFLMKDAYSFHADMADLDAFYPRVQQAYRTIFARCGLSVVMVQADPGMIGGSGSHEFVLPSPVGEETIVLCGQCSYAADADLGEVSKRLADEPPPALDQPPALVETPGVTTIADLAYFFNRPPTAFLKTVFFVADGRLVAACIRGDLEISEAKLRRVIGAQTLRLATAEELQAVGIPPGFGSPVGLRNVLVVADDSVPGRSFIAGANRPDYHLLNVVPGRDFQADIVADIAQATAGWPCARCGGPVESTRGLELGHTFKLGITYSQALGATYRAADGHEHPLVMGCYGIGLDRLMAAIVEQHHDEKGIVWPPAVAPADLHLCALAIDQPAVRQEAEILYQRLQQAGYQVLYDDRDESPGVKFADADLIGIPWRLTVSPRTLQAGVVELKARTAPTAELVPRDDLFQRLSVITGRATRAG